MLYNEPVGAAPELDPYRITVSVFRDGREVAKSELVAMCNTELQLPSLRFFGEVYTGTRFMASIIDEYMESRQILVPENICTYRISNVLGPGWANELECAVPDVDLANWLSAIVSRRFIERFEHDALCEDRWFSTVHAGFAHSFD